MKRINVRLTILVITLIIPSHVIAAGNPISLCSSGETFGKISFWDIHNTGEPSFDAGWWRYSLNHFTASSADYGSDVTLIDNDPDRYIGYLGPFGFPFSFESYYLESPSLIDPTSIAITLQDTDTGQPSLTELADVSLLLSDFQNRWSSPDLWTSSIYFASCEIDS